MVPVSEVAMFGLLQSSLSAVLRCSVKSVRVLSGLHGEFFCSVFAGSSTVLLNKTQRSTKILNITLQYCRFTNFYSTLQKVYRIHIVILIVACSTVLDYFAKTNEQTKRFANEKTRNDSQTKRTNTKRFANEQTKRFAKRFSAQTRTRSFLDCGWFLTNETIRKRKNTKRFANQTNKHETNLLSHLC